MAQIRNQSDLRAWLSEHPDVAAMSIAARLALRAIPFLSNAEARSRSTLILSTFRAVAVALAAVKYKVEVIELPFAAIDAITAAVAASTEDTDVTFAAAYASSAATSAVTAIAYAAADAATSAASAAASSFASSAVDIDRFWKAIEIDASSIEIGLGIDKLMRRPLWKRTPNKVRAGWHALKSDLLLREDESWTVWTDWYEERLAGRAGRKRLEIARALISEDIWKRPPAEVNRHIQTLIDQFEPEKKNLEVVPKPDAPIVARVPPLRAAAIEPDVYNGRIVLAVSPAKSTADPEAIAIALATLRAELDELAEDIEREDNLDKRFARRLRAIAERCATEAPTQFELFRLGHDYSIVAAFTQTVDAEWPGHLIASYRALQLHFERCVRKFPKWIEFLDQPKETVATLDDIKMANQIGRHIVEVARSEASDPVIDPAIPDAIEQLLGENSVSDLTAVVSASARELSADILESANNVLKRGAELLFAIKAHAGRIAAPVGKIAQEGWEVFEKGLKKGYMNLMEKAGEKAIPILITLLSGGFSRELYGRFPETFRWLHDLSDILHTFAQHIK